MPVIFPYRRLDQGTYQFVLPAPAPPAAARSLAVSLLRDNWPNTGGDVVGVIVEVSEDDQETWSLLLKFTAAGGQFTHRDGSVSTNSGANIFRYGQNGETVPLFDSTNPLRRIRVTIEVFSGIDTEVNMDLS